MFTCAQQKHLVTSISQFLSENRLFTDSFIIDFFTEDLWGKLPESWRPVLDELTYPQVADLLLDPAHTHRRYPQVWPLTLLAYRSAAHALAFPRGRCSRTSGLDAPEEFLQNQSQSAVLEHIFRKHVKPKKQHEIRRLGELVKRLSEETGVSRVVDVGSGQGHLTRFLSFGLQLSVTAVEADSALVTMATKFDKELQQTLEKRKILVNSAASDHFPRHVTGFVKPGASWEDFVQHLELGDLVGSGHCNEGLRSPDFLLTGLHACGDLSTSLLRLFVLCPHVRGITSVACCYMKVSTAPDPQATDPQTTDPQTTDPQATDPQATDPQATDPQATDPQATDPQTTDPQTTDPQTTDPQTTDPQTTQQEGPQWGYPMSAAVRALPGHHLSYRAREASCHALEDFLWKLREDSDSLQAHVYRAALETFITELRPDLRRSGVQTGKKSYQRTFTEYARLGLTRVGLDPDLSLDPERIEFLLQQQNRVVVFYSLCLLLSPVVETLILLDRVLFLQEHGFCSELVPIFDPGFSARNLVLVALKSRANDFLQ